MFNATFRYPVAAAAAALGSSRAHYFTRQQEEEHHRKHQHVLPSGEIRGCCCDLPDSVRIHEMKKQYDDGVLATSRSQVLSTSTDPLSIRLREIVGPEHCIGPDSSSQRQFLKGARLGKGSALAVVRPGSLQEALEVLRACVAAGAVVIPQGANTGLTGGSVPRNDDGDDRPAVILNMRRLSAIHPLTEHDADGEPTVRMLCLAGAGLHDLVVKAANLDTKRESHSALGSSFLNPTVAAGVAFGSGGTQLRKGPVFTERALWCRVADDGSVLVFNSTGIGSEDGLDVEGQEPFLVKESDQAAVLALIEAGGETSDKERGSAQYEKADKKLTRATRKCLVASDAERYSRDICELNGSVSRFNADTRGIDPVRSEGKVLLLASVHDTFPVPRCTRTYWVACDTLVAAQRLKQAVVLGGGAQGLPLSCEYMNQDSLDIIDTAGRGLCHLLLTKTFRPGSRPFLLLWNFKVWIESLTVEGMPIVQQLCSVLPDHVLFAVNGLLPSVLPPCVQELTGQKGHHLLITAGDFGGGELAHFEERLTKFLAEDTRKGTDKGPCTKVAFLSDEGGPQSEVARVNMFRFAAAPAFRTYCVGMGLQGLSLDYALPKNFDVEPALFGDSGSTPSVAKRMRYSHFGCNVVHEDIAFVVGVDVHAQKKAIKHEIEAQCGGRLPAEHGHGTEYHAPIETRKRWERIDPTNVMNPGVGQLDPRPFYGRRHPARSCSDKNKDNE